MLKLHRLSLTAIGGILLFSACFDQPSIAVVPSPAGDHSVYPDLLSTEQGLFLLWTQDAGPNSQLRMARYDGENWSDTTRIAPLGSAFINWADFPALFQSAGGRLLTYALPTDEGGHMAYNIDLYQSANGGQAWSGPHRPHRDSAAAEHGFVSFFPLAGGATGMVWLDGRNYASLAAAEGHEHDHEGADMMLQTAVVDAQGQVLPEMTLDRRVCSCCQTSAAALPNGGAIVAYRDRDSAEIRDISYVRLLDGQWTEPRKLNDDQWKIAACPVNGPSLASRGEQVAAAWFTGAANDPRVFFKLSKDAGASFGPALQLNEQPALGRVDLAWLDDETVLVSYLEQSENSAVLYLKRIDAEGQVEDRLQVAGVSGGRGMGFPRLAVFQGYWYLAWTKDQEPERVTIWRGKI